MAWKVWGSNSGRDNIFSVLPNLPNKAVVTTSLLFNVIFCSLPVVNWPVGEADDTSPSSDEVKMSGAITPLHLSLQGVDRDNVTVYTNTYICIYTAVCAKYIQLHATLFSERNRNAMRMKFKSCS